MQGKEIGGLEQDGNSEEVKRRVERRYRRVKRIR